MRTASFVLGLLARWHRRVVSPRPLGLAFLRRAQLRSSMRALLSTSRSDVRVQLQPRIALALVRHAAPASTSVIAATTRVVPPVPGSELVLRPVAAARAERLAARVAARGVRVESTAVAGVSTERDAPLRPVASPLERGPSELVVRREAFASAPDARSPMRELDLLTASSTAAVPAVLTPQLDVAHLTDQVLSTIDERLVARAERLGRS